MQGGTSVGDLNDLLDIFSKDDEDDKETKKKTDDTVKEQRTDIRSTIVTRLKSNPFLLFVTIFGSIAIVALVLLLLVKYASTSIIKGILDSVKSMLG
jgi:hypothetical protein